MDLRTALNAVSDVVANRPPAIREFDQIYMKHADLLIQAELVSKWFSERDVVFIGDGDAVGLCLCHLYNQRELAAGPNTVLILDFDERVIESVKVFAARYGLQDRISARLYNVADPLPEDLWGKYSAFYTNPPYGARNSGVSIQSFVRRGLEACGPHAIGCVVLADNSQEEDTWPQDVLFNVQQYLLRSECIVVEMVPRQHTYHLEDDPNLTSCSIVFRKTCSAVVPYTSEALSDEDKHNFYGSGKHLVVRYVRDGRQRSDAGLPISSEYQLDRFNE